MHGRCRRQVFEPAAGDGAEAGDLLGGGQQRRIQQHRQFLVLSVAGLRPQPPEQGGGLLVPGGSRERGDQVQPHPAANGGVLDELHGPGQVVEPRRLVAAEFRPAEVDQHAGQHVRGRRLREGPGQVGHRAGVPLLGNGLPSGLAQHADGVRVADGGSAQEMGGDVVHRRAGSDERLRRAHVRRVAGARAEVAVHGGADDRVDETGRYAGTQQARVGERPLRLGDLVPVQARHLDGGLEAGLVAQHGHGLDQGGGGRAQALETAQHQAHDLGRSQLGDVGRTEVRPVTFGGCQFAGQFGEQEGHAAGRRVAGRRVAGGRRAAERRPEVVVDARFRERPGPQELGHRVHADGTRDLVPRIAGGRVGGDGEQHGAVVDARGEVVQEAERGPVDRLDVVDQERQGRRLGDVDAHPVQAVQVGVVVPGPVVALGDLRRTVFEQRGGEPGRSAEHPVPLLRSGRAEPVLEQLAHDAVGERALELHAAGPENGDLLAGRPVVQGSQQGGPPGPRSPLHDQ